MIESVVIMLVIGAVLGIGLGFASEKFYVETDPAFDDVLNMLPGLNCGACGYPGCNGLAEALVDDKRVKPALCKPASQDARDKISYYLEEYFESKGSVESKKSVSGKTIGRRED
jgi:electron transport complex protein RnfB